MHICKSCISILYNNDGEKYFQMSDFVEDCLLHRISNISDAKRIANEHRGVVL
jgi:hypothetical protein